MNRIDVYLIENRLLAVQSKFYTKGSIRNSYEWSLFRSVKRMRNMNELFEKPQDETNQLLTELENELK